tara:strand:- start:843 stop:998 length:156 start_codon:yes stop_codon:yes gene_type:complete
MNCDYCGKKTAFLEYLDYCSVCVDCLGEIEEAQAEQEKNPFDLSEKNKNNE